MPKKIKFENNLPAMYRLTMYQVMLIAWVSGIRAAMPNYKPAMCIRLFLDHYAIPEEQWSLLSAQNFYYNSCNGFSAAIDADKSMHNDNLTQTINDYGKENSHH